MRYLITGGAGFIGSHLTDALLGRNDEVLILDDVSTGSLSNLQHLQGNPHLRITQGSILDAGLVEELTAEADVVIHLAAAVGVRLIVERPLESLMTNIRGTENVLEAAAHHDRRTLITSTSEIYGKNAGGPVREDADRILGSPYVARWSYSTSKAVDEILAHAYYRERGLETIVVRLFNCIGPRQTGDYGMVVPTFVRQALAHEALTVHGDGQQRRSFCHVADTVTALIALLDTPTAAGDVFNVGAHNEITMEQLAKTIVEKTGSGSEILFVPYAEAFETGFEDMERRLPDIGKIQALTGCSPTRDLDDMLDDVIAFETARVPADR
jgi:UDP-glucose 4-epimerase